MFLFHSPCDTFFNRLYSSVFSVIFDIGLITYNTEKAYITHKKAWILYYGTETKEIIQINKN